MRLSEHVTLAEFTASDTAERRRIDNSLPPELLNAAQNTAAMVEKIRAVLGDNAIIITSGYRCPDLNRAIGSGDTSDHLKAAAVDFKCPSFGSPQAIAMHLSSKIDSLGIGQLIYEFGSWVHVSTRRPSKDINRVITINQAGTHAGIVA
jgi:uncharacterized protein YcbK (DUF882 family)